MYCTLHEFCKNTLYCTQTFKLLVELASSLKKLTYRLIYIMLNTGPYIALYIVLYSVHCTVHCTLHYTTQTPKLRADMAFFLRNTFLPASSTFLLNTILFNVLYTILYNVLYNILYMRVTEHWIFYTTIYYTIYPTLYTSYWLLLHTVHCTLGCHESLGPNPLLGGLSCWMLIPEIQFPLICNNFFHPLEASEA